MKTCAKCKQDKELSEFSFRYKNRNILQSVCKPCKREIDNNDYQREGRKISLRKAQTTQRAKTKEFIDNYKRTHPCVKCGESRFYVLDFHHTGSNKSYNIGESKTKGKSIYTVQEELDKCILLCANCHRELHHLERLADNQDV